MTNYPWQTPSIKQQLKMKEEDPDQYKKIWRLRERDRIANCVVHEVGALRVDYLWCKDVFSDLITDSASFHAQLDLYADINQMSWYHTTINGNDWVVFKSKKPPEPKPKMIGRKHIQPETYDIDFKELLSVLRNYQELIQSQAEDKRVTQIIRSLEKCLSSTSKPNS